MSFIYHYTDSLRLPCFLETGELRPSSNRTGDFAPDFLWATTDENGDRTSSAAAKAVRTHWRKGELLLIRFVLDERDFNDWEPVARSLGWTKRHIHSLKKAARSLGESDSNRWRCRPEPLAITKALRIEARWATANTWVAPNRFVCLSSKAEPGFRAVAIGDRAYGGIRRETINGRAAYDFVRPFPVTLADKAFRDPHSNKEAR